MTKTEIIIYRGFNIETTNFGKLTCIEVCGNYTGKHKDAKEDFGTTFVADKLSADIMEDKDGFQFTLNLQDAEWIHLNIYRKALSSIDECIELMKKCVDRYLYRE